MSTEDDSDVDELREPGVIVPIRSVEITNFRGIRSTVLPLDKSVTVLFGANAAGKTTILDALAIALGAVVSRVPTAVGRDFAVSGDIRRTWKDRVDVGEVGGVECDYARVRMAAANAIQWDVTHVRSKQDRESIPSGVGSKQLQETLDTIIREVLEAAPGQPTRPVPFVAAYGTDRATLDVAPRDQAYERDPQRLMAFDRSLRAGGRFRDVFGWFARMEDEERRERDRRKDFSFLLPDLEWIRLAVAKAELHCRNPRMETRPLRMLVDFEHVDGSIETLDMASLSDGYRTHFSLVVDLARRMVQLNPSADLSDLQRATNTPSIVLIDEVDMHLDPPWQARVVRGLVAAFPKTQFVLTTHSEQVLGSVEAACVHKLVWDDGEILVEPVPFAQGATGERILIDLMGAPARVTGPITALLQEYLTLVSGGAGEQEEAKKIREQLEVAIGHDPALHRADLEMQRRTLMAKLAEKRPPEDSK